MAIDERSKAMYQPWNQEGFGADLRVRKMTNVQRWIYRTLLQEAFVCSTRPRLPDDDEELWMMADCEDINEWKSNKGPVLRMFQKVQVDGVSLLANRRLDEDWDKILNIRESKSEAGRKSGETRRAKKDAERTDVQQKATGVEHMLPFGEQVSKYVSNEMNVSNENEVAPPLSNIFDKEIQQESDMKVKTEVPLLSREILGVRAETWETVWSNMRELEKIHGGSAVCNAFKEWAKTKVGEVKDKPVSEFLKIADGLLNGILTVAAKSELTDLVDNLVFSSRGDIRFNEAQRFILGKLLDIYSPEEIETVFRDFYQEIRNDPQRLKYASKTFSEEAEQSLRFQRRRAKESYSEQILMDAAREKMTKEANERVAEMLRKEQQEISEAETELS